MDLFEVYDETSEGGDVSFEINKKYAAKYKQVKQKQELSSLRQKYGDTEVLGGEGSSSSSESEDEDAEALTPQIEAQFLKTLSMIQKRDPAIYDKDSKFFEEHDSLGNDIPNTNEKGKKSMTIKDYERKRLLEKGTKAFVSDSEDDSDDEKPIRKTYIQEQEDIKNSFLQAYEEFDATKDDDDILCKREKTSEEKVKEEADYSNWLQKHDKATRKSGKNDTDALKRYWNDPGLNEGEKFLRDYILGRKYIDKDNNELPSYDDIIQDGSEEENDDLIEKQEEFERKFNFRYEEPDEEFIKSYPRTIKSSVRRADDKRSKKRKEREARKNEEKEKKKLELKQLKNLKRKEIMEKIEKLKEITGNASVGFIEEDIDGDFDPKKYDELMQKVFNEDYYVDEEESKPEFQEDEEIDILPEEQWDSWEGYQGEDTGVYEDSGEAHCEDAEFNMDADYDPTAEEATLSKRQRKKSRLAQALLKKKPVYNPEDKSFEEYFDEYYKLDYEDIVGDLPVRFKYRDVMPNSFGLSTQEILTCEDTELNKWCPLKRATRYSTKDEERIERRKYNKKARDKQHKLQILTSLKNDEEDEGTKAPNRGKKSKVIKSSISSRKLSKFTQKRHLSLHSVIKGGKTNKLARRAKFDILRKLRDDDKKKTSKIPADRLAAYGLLTKKKKKSKS